MENAHNQDRFKDVAQVFTALENQQTETKSQAASTSNVIARKTLPTSPITKRDRVMDQVRQFSDYIGNPDNEGPLFVMCGLVSMIILSTF